MPIGADLLRARARELPDAPGVYVMRDEAERVLYVGKAKALRKRVASYARADRRLDRKTEDLIARVADVETIVATSESEALLLEQTLIKRHRPPFNIRLRDDKSYPYIAVTVSDRYPRVLFTRERHRRGVRYFGPYASASKVRETLDVLNRVFPYRPCEGPQPGRRAGIPCLDFHIGRCLAPCIGEVSEADYAEVIANVIRVLEGDTRRIERDLERSMHAAASDERYEEAARVRNRLHAIRHLRERQLVATSSGGDVDVLGVAEAADVACVQVFPLRAGRLGERFSFVLENVAGATVDDLVRAALEERYGGAFAAVPPLVCVPDELGRPDDLAGTLSGWRDARVEVRVARRGELRRLSELATRNAHHALRESELQADRSSLRRFGALEELRDVLNLEALPMRVECFDISNLGDQATMASMVVFEGGRPRKAHYRVFGIESAADGPDDFASMAEAIRRRFTRLADAVTAADGTYDAAFGSTPQLVVVDGGRGQLGAALAALQDLDLPRLSVVSLAKRIEEVYVPHAADPILLDTDSPALLLLQRIRDEAHRFALSHHRRRRSKISTTSLLEQFPGIGPARRRALQTHFRDPGAILGASIEELEAVPGLPRRTARALHAHLHRVGGEVPDA